MSLRIVYILIAADVFCFIRLLAQLILLSSEAELKINLSMWLLGRTAVNFLF